MSLIHHKQNRTLDFIYSLLKIRTCKRNIRCNHTKKLFIFSNFLVYYCLRKFLSPILVSRISISNNRLHIKFNNILNPLLYQMLIWYYNNYSKIIIKIF